MQSAIQATLSNTPATIIPYISVVVPVFNECPTLVELHARLSNVLDRLGRPYEIVFVDDGSRDGTDGELLRLEERNRSVRAVILARNYGQTAALAAGFDHARGQVVVAMDGDLENQPEDIPRLVAKLDEGYDVVSGWREQRQDGLFTRRIPSRAANWMMSRLSGVELHDFGCTLKAYRRDVLERITLHGELHRFIPALAGAHGARIAELPVAHRVRPSNRSHYGLSRIWRVAADLLTLRFLLRYATRPLHLFGPVAFVSMGAGGVAGAYALADGMLRGSALAHAPLLVASLILLAAGVNLLATGLVAELLVRVYYDGTRRQIYTERRRPRLATSEWTADLRPAAGS